MVTRWGNLGQWGSLLYTAIIAYRTAGSSLYWLQNSIILIIQGAIDHSCLENCSGTKYKLIYCVAIKNYLIYKIIIQWHGFQPPQNYSFTVSIHMFLFVYYSLSILLLEFTMVDFFIFHFALKKEKSSKK